MGPRGASGVGEAGAGGALTGVLVRWRRRVLEEGGVPGVLVVVVERQVLVGGGGRCWRGDHRGAGGVEELREEG